MNVRALLITTMLMACTVGPQPGPQSGPPPSPPPTGMSTEQPAQPSRPLPPGGPAAPSDPAATVALADGQSCVDNTQCTSGVCEGMGCTADKPGVCAPKARACTRDLREYCGCDGTTFRTSGSCPGRRYASTGACTGGTP